MLPNGDPETNDPALELAWAIEAWDSYKSCETADPVLYKRLSGRLRELASNSQRLNLRRIRMQHPPLFGIAVEGPNDGEWLILWKPGEEVSEIHYVGPSFL